MAIEDETTYGLTGAQLTDLADRVKNTGGIKDLTGTVALRELELGLYRLITPYSLTGPVNTSWRSDARLAESGEVGGYLIVYRQTNGTGGPIKSYIYLGRSQNFSNYDYNNAIGFWKETQNSAAFAISSTSVVDTLGIPSGLYTNAPLSAEQGRVLNVNKLAVDNLLAGTGITLDKTGTGANQTVTINATGGSGGIPTIAPNEDGKIFLADLDPGFYEISSETAYNILPYSSSVLSQKQPAGTAYLMVTKSFFTRSDEQVEKHDYLLFTPFGTAGSRMGIYFGYTYPSVSGATTASWPNPLPLQSLSASATATDLASAKVMYTELAKKQSAAYGAGDTIALDGLIVPTVVADIDAKTLAFTYTLPKELPESLTLTAAIGSVTDVAVAGANGTDTFTMASASATRLSANTIRVTFTVEEALEIFAGTGDAGTADFDGMSGFGVTLS